MSEIEDLLAEIDRQGEQIHGLRTKARALESNADGWARRAEAAEARLRKVEALPVRHLFDDTGIKPFVRLADIEMALATEDAS